MKSIKIQFKSKKMRKKKRFKNFEAKNFLKGQIRGQTKIWGHAGQNLRPSQFWSQKRGQARPGQVLEYATPNNQSYCIPEADNYTAE